MWCSGARGRLERGTFMWRPPSAGGLRSRVEGDAVPRLRTRVKRDELL